MKHHTLTIHTPENVDLNKPHYQKPSANSAWVLELVSDLQKNCNRIPINSLREMSSSKTGG